MSRKKRQSFAECSLSVAILIIDQGLSGFLKDRNNFILDLFKLFHCVSERCSDDIIRLGHTDFLKQDTCLVFNQLDEHLLL